MDPGKQSFLRLGDKYLLLLSISPAIVPQAWELNSHPVPAAGPEVITSAFTQKLA